MTTQRLSVLIVTASMSAFLGGCEKKVEVSNANCEDLDKIANPVQRAELLKRCPHAGPAFKPSPIKGY